MIRKLKKKKVLYGIGLMSGTSLDGVDVALVKIINKKEPIFELIGFESVPYPVSLKERILKNSKNATSCVQEICSLNVEISKEYVKAINVLLDNIKFDLSKIDFISSHGQTIWHNPNEMDGYASSTFQIGDASTISRAFNKLVIYDFRTLDMAYGGSGAPLIPISEYMLYRTNYDRVLLNIGGISNITYMKKNASIKDVFAFLQVTDSNNAYLEYIFGAQSITDLIFRTAISEQLVEYNNDLIEEYNATVKKHIEENFDVSKRNF